MATKIYFIRHGLTPWNNIHRYQGHTDIELSTEGIKQALALKRRFMNNQLEAIYSSDLRRALKTAEIINEVHQLPIQVLPALKEINFGAWEGLIFAEIAEKYPELAQKWLTEPQLVQIPEGETISMVQERGMRVIKQIITEHPYGQVLVVAHGVIIATMICSLLRLPAKKMKEYKQDNTAVSIIKVFPVENSPKKEANVGYQASLKLFNDLSHL